jgi:hypothetical protein
MPIRISLHELGYADSKHSAFRIDESETPRSIGGLIN